MQNIITAATAAIQKERYGHTSSALIGDKLYIFGGLVVSIDNNNELVHLTNTNDLLEATVAVVGTNDYNVNDEGTINSQVSATWTEVTGAVNTPSPRNFHSCAVYQDKMYIFGGKSNGYLNDLHMYDPLVNTWTQLKYDSSLVPERRYGHSACVINGEMFVFGGYDSNGYSCDDLMALDLNSLKWRNVALKGTDAVPSGRHQHSMSDCGKYLLIYGGTNAQLECLNDLYAIDTETGTCFTMKTAREGRYGHVSFCYKEGDKYMLSIIGGCSKTLDLYNDSFIFEIEPSFTSASIISTLGQYMFTDKVSTAAPCYPVFCTISTIPHATSDRHSLLFFGGTRKNEGAASPSISRKGTTSDIDPQLEQLIHNMPDDVGLVVLSFLDRRDLCSVSNVSKNWKLCKLSEHNIFWKPWFEKTIKSALYEPVKKKVLDDTSTDNYKKKLLILREKYHKYLKKRVNARKAEILSRSLSSNQQGNFHQYVGVEKLKRKFKGITTQEQVKKKFGISGVNHLRYNYDKRSYEPSFGIKVVVVGDGATGKTSLLIRAVTGAFPEDYVPTVFDNYSALQQFCGDTYEVTLWDTAGPEDYDRLRPLSYPHTNVFLVCFSVINPWSFTNIHLKWVPEIMHHCPGAVMVLIGTKVDLRDDPHVVKKLRDSNSEPLTEEEGILLAQQQKCALYVETSALTGKNLKGPELFELLIQTALDFDSKQSPNSQKKNGKCMIH